MWPGFVDRGPHSGDWAETGELPTLGSVDLFPLVSFPETFNNVLLWGGG